MSVQVAADDLGFAEGPVALPDGRVAVVSISHGCVYVIDAGGTVERIETGGGPNGLALGPAGELYVAQNGGIWGGSGPAAAGVQVVCDGRVEYLATDGMRAPNDLCFGPDGRLWVTDTVAEMEWGRPETGTPGRLVAVDIHTGAVEVIVEEGPIFLNGLAFSADGSELLVTATADRRVLAYALTSDRSLARGAELAPGERPSVRVVGDPRVVAQFAADAVPDGMARTGDDRFWVALLGADRLDLVDRSRGTLGSLRLPAGCLPTNVCLDHEGAGLLVTAGFAGALLRVAGESLVSSLPANQRQGQ